MKKLGKILFPEQYAPVGKEVSVSNSVEALRFFEKFYPKGGIVLLGNIRLACLQMPDMLVWIYFDIQSDEPKIISTIPVFEIPKETLNGVQILDITPHQNEVFSIWKNTLYSSVFTSTGEVCIKKVRLFLSAREMVQVIEMRDDTKVEDIYPVELYSHSKHKFIGVCWAVLIEDTDTVFWHPICLEEEDAIMAYPAEDLSDHPIEVDETADIAGDTFKLHYTDKDGFFFQKLEKKKPRLLHLDLKEYTQTAPQQPKGGNGIILPPLQLRK